jgi:hypothetical protein
MGGGQSAFKEIAENEVVRSRKKFETENGDVGQRT